MREEREDEQEGWKGRKKRREGDKYVRWNEDTEEGKENGAERRVKERKMEERERECEKRR